MSSASELLDALLAESDDEALPSNYSVDDVLNDKSEFDVESILSAPVTDSTSASQIVEEKPSSSSSVTPQAAHTSPLKQQRPPSPITSAAGPSSLSPTVTKVRNSIPCCLFRFLIPIFVFCYANALLTLFP